jgi:hypothetical protein
MGAKLSTTAVPRALLSAVTATVSLAVLTGCASVNTASGGQSPATFPGTAQPAAGDHSATTPPGTRPTEGGGVLPSKPVPANPPSTLACASDQLEVARGNPDAAAGQLYVPLTFTNVSKAACTLSGYPGVSYVAENGVQSGNAAERTGEAASTVLLKPGVTAVAKMHDSNGVGGYDPNACMLSPAQGLRIYPPNLKAAVFLPWKVSHCAGASIHALTIGPVQLG